MSSKNNSSATNPFPKTDGNRFAEFTDDEIYILSRQSIESSGEIIANIKNRYSVEHKEIHSRLMNEIIMERIRRGL